MLNAAVFRLGNVTVVRCRGRIVVGENHSILRNVVLGQAQAKIVVLDLAQVDRVDAGGLGVLLNLREWTRFRAIRFKLMNVMNKVQQVLELTKLDLVFEFCSVKDLLYLLHHAAAVGPSTGDGSNLAAAIDVRSLQCRRPEAAQ
jgi:anti-anti-sigma factor